MPVKAYLTFQAGSSKTKTVVKPCGLKKLGEKPMEGGRGQQFLGGDTPQGHHVMLILSDELSTYLTGENIFTLMWLFYLNHNKHL